MNDDHENITPPAAVPAPGFYYHYKHDPEGPVNGYAYEVLGVGHHTEDDARPEDTFMVVYRPLYDWALVYKLGKMFDLRPLDMFMEGVNKPDYQGPRFNPIADPGVARELEEIRAKMY